MLFYPLEPFQSQLLSESGNEARQDTVELIKLPGRALPSWMIQAKWRMVGKRLLT